MAHRQGQTGSGGEQGEFGNIFNTPTSENEVFGAGALFTTQESDTNYDSLALDFGGHSQNVPPQLLIPQPQPWGPNGAQAALAYPAYTLTYLDGRHSTHVAESLNNRTVFSSSSSHEIGDGMTGGYSSISPSTTFDEAYLDPVLRDVQSSGGLAASGRVDGLPEATLSMHLQNKSSVTTDTLSEPVFGCEYPEAEWYRSIFMGLDHQPQSERAVPTEPSITSSYQQRLLSAAEGASASFASSSQVSNHGGSEGRPYRCNSEDCGKTFRSQSGLTHHKRIHDPTKKSSHTCSICGGTFRYPKDLARHDLSRHKRGTPNQLCRVDGCDKSYVRRDHLLRHIRTAHSAGAREDPELSIPLSGASSDSTG